MIDQVVIALCDVLNPGFGYQVRVVDERGLLLISASKDPVTGSDLLSLADAIRVAATYASPAVSP